MDIEVCVYIENGTEITSSHRSSNGFVYSGYHYQKPIVYTSMPFNLSDEQKESITPKKIWDLLEYLIKLSSGH